MADKALNYLGIMRKAGACAAGETDCGSSCRAGKAKVLLVASDAAENARSRARGCVYGAGRGRHGGGISRRRRPAGGKAGR